ncbi:MAG TPA: hypothetical protein VMW83_05665 [Spirochaetia bacterium]|nr:hypothetical protein [Spirochaetia bacterium]
MNTKKSIQQLVKGVPDELKAQGYSPGTIKGYDASYMDLLAYADDNGIHEYSQAVGLGYKIYVDNRSISKIMGSAVEENP